MVLTTVLLGVTVGNHPLIRRLLLFIGSTTLLFLSHEYITPRLPAYTIQIQTYPLIHFVKSSMTHHWQMILSTNIQFYNENYLHLSIHSMTFDAYIERYDGESDTASLLHMATITDQMQHQSRPSDGVLWSIPGRANFTIRHCPLYMSFFETTTTTTTTTTTATYIRSILLLLYKLVSYTIRKLWQKDEMIATFTIPTTGVAHIRASVVSPDNNETSHITAMPFTVGMICNNEVNMIRLQIVGVKCQQYMMVPGWSKPISKVAERLRNHAITELMIHNTTTGSVFG